MIYVSLFEHIAVVLGDQQVVSKLGQPFLDQLCQQLTQALRQGDYTTAICQTITTAGLQLSNAFPRAANDVNELADVLVLID